MEIYYRRAERANKTRVRVLRYDEVQAKSEFDRQCYLLSAICHYEREKYDEFESCPPDNLAFAIPTV